MLIGVPKEIKNHEYRVGLIPNSVRELVHRGHHVFIETNAGKGCGFNDENYINVGAEICSTAQEVFEKSDMIVKIKEPQPIECKMLKPNQIIFTFLHLAADRIQAEGLIDSKCVAIAYETVTNNSGGLPLLAPMSEVAGRMATQVGAHYLEKGQGGSGVLLGGVPGVLPGKIVIVGGGVVGTNAAKMAIGMGAEVTILDKSLPRLRELDDLFSGRVKTVYSTFDTLEELVAQADLVVGAVLIPGALAPKIVTSDMIRKMPNGSVIVDVAIDQGGCFETSRITTHESPTFIVDGVIHYCVTNIPGSVARTSAIGLNNATLPYVIELSEKGYHKALLDNVHLRNGLNVYKGSITYEHVADDLGYDYVSPMKVLNVKEDIVSIRR